MENKKKFRRKVGMILGLIGGVILLLFLGFFIYFIKNIEEKSKKFLIESVRKSTDDLYRLDIRTVRINLLKKQIAAYDIQLNVNEERLLASADTEIDAHYHLFAEKIEISADHFIAAFRQKSELSLEKLEIIHPEISVYPRNIAKKEGLSPERERHRILPSFIHGLTLKEINIVEGSFQQFVSQNSDSLFFSIDGLNFYIQTLYLNAQDSNSNAPLFEKVQMKFRKTTCHINNYQIELENLKVSDHDYRNFTIDTLIVMPDYNKYIFPQKVRLPTAAEVVVSGISIVGMNIEEILYRHELIIDTILISDYQVNTFKDKNIPPTPVVKPLFSEMLLNLSMPLKIGKVIVEQGNIHHEEIAEGKSAIGKVLFNNFRGVISNVTNRIDTVQNYCTADVYGKVYNTGDITIHYSFSIDPSNTQYHLSGKIKNLNLGEVNAISEAAANMKIKSGEISELTFSMSANDKTASLDMLMLYQDFEISLLKANHEKNRWLISELANDFILLRSNPKGKHEAREIKQLHLRRQPYYFQFNHIWNTLFEGIKISIGLGPKEQKMINKHQK